MPDESTNDDNENPVYNATNDNIIQLSVLIMIGVY